MAPQDFLLLAANEADEVIIADRAAHRHSRLRLRRLGLLSTEGAERPGDRADQIAQIAGAMVFLVT